MSIDPNLLGEHLTKGLFAIPVAIVGYMWRKLHIVDILTTRVAVLENNIRTLEHKIDLLLEATLKKSNN